MADKFGALTLPEPTDEVLAGDPALFYLGHYLQAVLNARIGAAWKATLVPNAAPSLAAPVVQSVRFSNPAERGFVETDLPALYLFRGESIGEQWADEWNVEITPVEVQWVFATAVQFEQIKRAPFVNAISKTVHAAIEVGRHPSYSIEGDPDATAPTAGSWIYADRYMNPVALHFKSARPSILALRQREAVQHTGYPMIAIRLSLTELSELSIEDYAAHESLGVAARPDGGTDVAQDIFTS